LNKDEKDISIKIHEKAKQDISIKIHKFIVLKF